MDLFRTIQTSKVEKINGKSYILKGPKNFQQNVGRNHVLIIGLQVEEKKSGFGFLCNWVPPGSPDGDGTWVELQRSLSPGLCFVAVFHALLLCHGVLILAGLAFQSSR